MCADNFNNRKMFERRNVGHDNKYQGAPTKCRLSRIRNIKFTQPSSLLLVWTEQLGNVFSVKMLLLFLSSPLVVSIVYCQFPMINIGD